MTGPHLTPISPRWYELDPYRHVNHSVYVQYFEVARIALLEEIGFGIDKMADVGSSIVVTEIRTRFLAPATLGDDLIIETELVEMRRASTVWSQSIRRRDQIIATQQVTAAVLGESGRPARLPEGFRVAMEPFRRAAPGSRPRP